MKNILKDHYKLSLVCAVFFFISIGWTFYEAYALSFKIRVLDPQQVELQGVYIAIGRSLVFGALAIWLALKHRNEVIVYREKIADKQLEEQDTTEGTKTTISLETIKSSLKPGNMKEKLQSGLHAICKQLDAGQGAIYLKKEDNGIRKMELQAGYALNLGETTVISFEHGEGLVGQAAAGAKTLYVDEVPNGYIKIISGLGNASPRYLLVVPMKQDQQVAGVMEIASFTPISDDEKKFVEESAQLIAASI